MRLTHRQDVPAPLEEVWSAFTDLRRVGRCFPGAAVTEVDGVDFVGEVRVRLGPVGLSYDGEGTLAEADETERRAVVRATGRERHGLGRADIEITVLLAPAEGGGTAVSVQTDLDVRGAPTTLGSGLAQRVSDPLVGSFIACMGGGAEPEEDAPVDVGRAVLPGLVASYGRSLRERVRRR